MKMAMLWHSKEVQILNFKERLGKEGAQRDKVLPRETCFLPTSLKKILSIGHRVISIRSRGGKEMQNKPIYSIKMIGQSIMDSKCKNSKAWFSRREKWLELTQRWTNESRQRVRVNFWGPKYLDFPCIGAPNPPKPVLVPSRIAVRSIKSLNLRPPSKSNATLTVWPVMTTKLSTIWIKRANWYIGRKVWTKK